jgi:hypothetical protein
MAEMSLFKNIAVYLTNPLVLAGLTLAMMFGVQREMLRATLIKALTSRARAPVVRNLARYGFSVGILVVVLCFGLSLYQVGRVRDPVPPTQNLTRQATPKEAGVDSSPTQVANAEAGSIAINVGRDFSIQR